MSYKLKTSCLSFSLFLALLLFWLNGYSQYNFTEIEQFLKQNSKEAGKNFAVLIWKDGKIIYQKQSQEFTVKTQTPIGNSGNWLTAALVMTFVDEGKISLDDKVSKYIPLFAKYMKSYITIRNCITNTTGIHTENTPLKIFEKSKFSTLGDEVNAYASKHEIEDNPGTKFFYSNIGPNIAARVLEIVSKKGFDRLIQERILRPLKMRTTNFTNDDGGAISASNGAKSSALDYMNFLVMMQNKGVFEGKRILSEKSVAEIETIQFAELPVKYIPKLSETMHYGLGSWIMTDNAGEKDSIYSCPNFLGTYPYFSNCRKYAAILILPNVSGELKKEFYVKFRGIIDGIIPSSCN
ncbi:MAG: serine hydrolase [Bacteroidetes bacterium]|nr:serine hydrolase [Bacteroidota bacterium]